VSDDQLSRIQDQFTRTAEIYARMRQTTDERMLDALVAVCEPAPSARAADIACGPGFLTLALARRCSEVIGFDATEAFLELARTEAATRGQQNVRFQQGNAEELPFGDGAFDLVTCRAAFHHFPRPGRVLSEMARVTAPGGRVLVADLLGSEDATQAELHDRIERLCDPTHERALPRTELGRLFDQAGLGVFREIPSSLDYDVDEWMDHGAPTGDARREIVSLMESSLEGDRAGLNVRHEAGRLRFSHRTAAFVLERAGSSATAAPGGSH
jgi:ubiquinone/menaquinone biosynthesis C-methylase UbiE